MKRPGKSSKAFFSILLVFAVAGLAFGNKEPKFAKVANGGSRSIGLASLAAPAQVPLRYFMIEIPSLGEPVVDGAPPLCSFSLTCQPGVHGAAMNDNGVVVGNSSSTPSGPGLPFVYRNFVSLQLAFPNIPPPAGFCAFNNGSAPSVNDDGTVVGTVGGPCIPPGPNAIGAPFRSVAWVPTDVDGHQPIDLISISSTLDVFPAASNGFSQSVSRSGQIVGAQRDTSETLVPFWTASASEPTALFKLGTSDDFFSFGRANAIAESTDNRATRICGYDETTQSPLPPFGSRGFIVEPQNPASTHYLSEWSSESGDPAFGNTLCVAMNESFDAVGASDVPFPPECSPELGQCDRHASLFLADFTLVDLGTLGGAHSLATAINRAGDVAGWSETSPSDAVTRNAFVAYRANGWVLQNLNDPGVVINRGDFVLSEAVAINVNSSTGAAEIVVNGYHPGAKATTCRSFGNTDGSQCHSFVVVPLPDFRPKLTGRVN